MLTSMWNNLTSDILLAGDVSSLVNNLAFLFYFIFNLAFLNEVKHILI